MAKRLRAARRDIDQALIKFKGSEKSPDQAGWLTAFLDGGGDAANDGSNYKCKYDKTLGLANRAKILKNGKLGPREESLSLEMRHNLDKDANVIAQWADGHTWTIPTHMRSWSNSVRPRVANSLRFSTRSTSMATCGG